MDRGGRRSKNRPRKRGRKHRGTPTAPDQTPEIPSAQPKPITKPKRPMLEQVQITGGPKQARLFLDVFTWENAPDRDCITRAAQDRIRQVLTARGISVEINHTCVLLRRVPAADAQAIAKEITDILEDGGLEDSKKTI